ncbi:flagellar export protein FliJ [Saccharospirillum sp. MSK14-1]|uniref:flagellar export protein FliJ n=1 Tax=Saccharospirillum sp. MSK14-1 TaxID=1897632 RepID=UPI0011B26A6A|nr:flagellar export protein FliJ [Saccharospirillum sp. MSK14-1]
MKRSERLQVIERLAKQREDQAAQALQQARAQLEQEIKQLDELADYQRDYHQSLQASGGGGISIEQWRRTQGFIDQLETVMGRQRGVIQQWQEQEAKLLAHWQSLYQRRKTLNQLVEKVSMEELIEADRREQKALDEVVSQMRQRTHSW